MLDKGFLAATTGYLMYKGTDLKIDAMNFGRAAEKFEKLLGNEIVTIGNSVSYKQCYQERVDKAGYGRICFKMCVRMYHLNLKILSNER